MMEGSDEGLKEAFHIAIRQLQELQVRLSVQILVLGVTVPIRLVGLKVERVS